MNESESPITQSTVTAAEQAQIRRIEKRCRKDLRKCEKKLEKNKKAINRRQRRLARKRVKCERKAALRILKWERKASRIRRAADEKIALVRGENLITPIDRDLDEMERDRLREEQEELACKSRAERPPIPAEQLKKNYPALYEAFCNCSFLDLEQHLRDATDREEKAFYRAMLNLKLQIEQEKIVGEVLL